MIHRTLALFLCLVLFVPPVAAESQSISRRDGFLLLWESIHRKAEDNREPWFTDVPEGSPGADEITYAKYRGLIDDDDPAFHPDQPLTRQDALLWLFRTRSVDAIEKITFENLPALLERYPLKDAAERDHHMLLESLAGAVTQEDVLTFMRMLDTQLSQEDHEVSLYGEKFHGKGTAFGETFDMHALTAAHRTFPYNTLVKVTNVRNGKSVTVRITDRGPYVDGRDMDLSVAAFTSIEDRSKGILRATFQRLGDATLVSQCGEGDSARAVRISGNTRLIGGIPSTLPLGQRITLRSTRPIVLRSILYPDGTLAEQQDWILPEESHVFTPAIEGEYVFRIGSKEGRVRAMKMNVVQCQKDS